MRAWNKQPSEEIRQRHLGEIAPLLEAARQLEDLPAERRKQVRRRIVRTVFGTRRLGFRARLTPVLAALAFLVLGGAAFATAQGLGLLPRLGKPEAGVPAAISTPEARKRRAVRGRAVPHPAPGAAAGEPSASAVGPVSEPMTVVLPEVPDPVLYPFPTASLWVWAPVSEVRTHPAQAPSGVARSVSVAHPAGRLAMATFSPAPGVISARAARVAAAAPTAAAALPYPAPRFERFEPRQPEALAPGPAEAPLLPPAVTSSAFAPAQTTAPASPAVVAPAAVASDTARPVPAQSPPLSDQALFGQALRGLRSHNNPTAALAALQEHARAYPRSAFAGERAALEVEALLALHRDRDALNLLDSTALDELPRSGERFVMRGELRAAARRWQDASADFDHALARVSGAPAWHERALWGRGVARIRLGEREAGMADIERYRDTYPKGRFAAEAAKFFPKK